MKLITNFHWQAHYNHAMNRQFYRTCAQIPDAQRKQHQGAFFKSIHGTFNHLLLTDKVWLSRIEGTPMQVTGLDQILYNDFAELDAAREEVDQQILSLVRSLTKTSLEEVITYQSVAKNAQQTTTLEEILTHLFLHQTHHRGQVSTLITQLGYELGETDILWITENL